MTEDVNSLVASVNINQILISIIETLGEVRVKTSDFVDAANKDKELVITYDEDSTSFIFTLKEKADAVSN